MVPAVMPGFWGSHLGVIDLALQRTASGWTVRGASVENRPVKTVVEGDAPRVAPEHEAVVQAVEELDRAGS